MSKRFFSESIDHWRWPDGDGCHDECPVCKQEEEDERRESFTTDEWQEDVRQGNTKLGFAAWVDHNMDTERDRILEERAAENRVRDAAPTLLKALDELCGILDVYADYWQNQQGQYGDILDSMDNARAAIALTEPPKKTTTPARAANSHDTLINLARMVVEESAAYGFNGCNVECVAMAEAILAEQKQT